MTRYSIGAMLLGALIALAAVDAAFWRLNPPNRLREVADALRDLESGNPDIVVMSSSHGRTFHAVGREIARRTSGAVTTLSIPLEGGRASAMEWVLRERFGPLLDAQSKRPDGARFAQLVFGITWWDTCRREQRIPIADANVVSRAWRATDYVKSVLSAGVNDLNRNFVRYRWQQQLRFSSLASDRGRMSNLRALKQWLRGQSSTRTALEEREFLQTWRTDIDTGGSCILARSELAAIERVVEFAREHRVQLTVVLFPLKPATITARGRAQTLQPFSSAMRAYGRAAGFRVLDLTEMQQIGDSDFMQDYDHLSNSGNEKFSRAVLDGPLAFLYSGARP